MTDKARKQLVALEQRITALRDKLHTRQRSIWK